MKTMEDYELRCTAKQTRRAWKLGAPITIVKSKRTKETIFADDVIEFDNDTFTYVVSPTTQRMIGWLREKGFLFKFEEEPNGINIVEIRKKLNNSSYRVICVVKTDKSAELAAIDAALDCLEKEKE